MRIGFFGTPSLAATVLADLYTDPQFEIAFVVTNPDKPWGRDQMMKMSPVKELALTHDTPVYQPVRVRGNSEFLDDIHSYDCDYFIVVAYGQIVPLALLQIPKKMCINVHGSILPAYRGASPIQAALLHGEKET
jgi:methionyl-tRNA formyltransferase